ncbi:hypothetical protein I79_011098 [Cricetulus griseus]|uniref:Uncharacterized protein n=1 Tax=Cricetulus griseus TaxID=10029 RepID=G3HK80_CRIGR|nr:hypothetical protein I79_011098 [Cricetulus griseus]
MLRCSAYTTYIQDTEAGTASGTGHTASQPSVRALGILTAGKPLAHASETPHGTAITLLAFAHRWLLAGLHQLHTGLCLHAACTGLKLLQRGSWNKRGHKKAYKVVLGGRRGTPHTWASPHLVAGH